MYEEKKLDERLQRALRLEHSGDDRSVETCCFGIDFTFDEGGVDLLGNEY